MHIKKTKRILKIKLAQFKGMSVEDIMSSDELINELIKLDKYQNLINEIREKAYLSQTGIINLITGKSAWSHINEVVFRLAFPDSSVFKSGTEGDRYYDVTGKGMMGEDPQTDESIAKFNRLLNGPVQAAHPKSSTQLAMEDEKYRNTIFGLLPNDANFAEVGKIDALFQNPQYSPFKKSINTYKAIREDVLGQNLLESLTIVPPSNPPDRAKTQRITKWTNAWSQARENEESSLREYNQYLNSEEYDKNDPTSANKLATLKRRHFGWSLFERFLGSKFQNVGGEYENPVIDPSKGFAGWDGTGQREMEQYVSFTNRLKKSFFRNSLEVMLNQQMQEIATIKQNKSLTPEQKKLRLSEIDSEIQVNKELLEGLQLSKEQGQKKPLEWKKIKSEYGNYLVKIIKEQLLPRLEALKGKFPKQNAPIQALEQHYGEILKASSPDVAVDIYGSRNQDIKSINDSLVALPNENSDFIIFKNVDDSTHPNGFVTPRQQATATKSPDQQEDALDQGNFVLKPNVMESLKLFVTNRNVGSTQKQHQVSQHKCVVFITGQKIDFPGMQGVTYIDLKDHPVDEQEAEVLIKFKSKELKTQIKNSVIAIITPYVVGRMIGAAIQIINEVLYKALKKGKGKLNVNDISDLCKEQSEDAGSSLNPLLVPIPTVDTRHDFVSDPTTTSGRFFSKKFREALSYRGNFQKYYRTLDKMDEAYYEAEKAEQTLRNTKHLPPMNVLEKKAFRDKFMQTPEMTKLQDEAKSFKEDVSVFTNTLNPLFYILHGVSATAKSYFPQVYAKELGYTFYNINLNDANNKWHGESERMIRDLFNAIKNLKNVVINFDEMDGSAFSIAEGGTDVARVSTGIRTWIQTYLEMNEKLLKSRNIVFFGSCNNPENLAKAILDRAQKVKAESQITEKTIMQVMTTTLNKIKNYLKTQGSDIAIPELVEKEWDKSIAIIKGFGPEVLKEAGKNFMDAKLSFRQLMMDLSMIIQNHFASTKIAEKIEKFNKDTTPDKSQFKQQEELEWEDWDSRGRPAELYEDFVDLRLTKETFLEQTKSAFTSEVSQDSGKTFETRINGMDRYSTEVLDKRFTGAPKPEAIDEKTQKPEQTQLDLDNLGNKKPEEDDDDNLFGDLAKPIDEVEEEDEKIVNPAEKDKKIKDPTQKEKTSTNYYYDYLLKLGFDKSQLANPQPQAQPQAKQPAPTAQPKPDSFKDSFKKSIIDIKEFRFIPLDNAFKRNPFKKKAITHD